VLDDRCHWERSRSGHQRRAMAVTRRLVAVTLLFAAGAGSVLIVPAVASAGTGSGVSLDANPGTKQKTATPAEVHALENRIQEFRNALNRATYKLETLQAQDRGRRPTHVQEALKLKRDIAYLKHKIKELNDELASLKIVNKPPAKVSVGG
jgi:hypothetical protein